jgi:DNA-binding winged helix-turn-helix (wHTH) protein/TolB-like protein
LPDWPHELRFGRVTVKPASRQLLVDGQPAPAGARAFDVLLALVERRDRVVSKEELLEAVWPGLVVEENNIQVQISALRKLLGAHAIATVPGRGYRFTLEPEPDAAEPEPSPSRLEDPAPVRAERHLSRAMVAAIAVLVLLVGAGTLWLGRVQPAMTAPQAAAPLRSLLILPVTAGEDDPGLSVLAMRLGADVARTLGDNLRPMRVSPPAAFVTSGRGADARALSREANVRFIVEGTVHRTAGDRLEFTLRLIDGSDGRQLDAE